MTGLRVGARAYPVHTHTHTHTHSFALLHSLPFRPSSLCQGTRLLSFPSRVCDEAMTNNFQSWEKDPFFFAAEQVQDAADRLDSAYRAWMHAKSLSSNAQETSVLDFFRRELSTALGIAKWQLEEFEKEVSLLSTDTQQLHAEDDTPQRHRQFIDAISNQLSSIKSVLLMSKDERDLNVLPAVRLGQEESDQLAHFLCGSRLNASEDKDMFSSCTSSGKGYKKMVTSCQAATSISSSGLECGKGLFGSLDECSSCPDTRISLDTNEPCISKDHIVDRPEIHSKMVSNTDFLCISGKQTDEAPTCATSDLLIRDCYNSSGTCIERPSGHRRSTSIGGGFSCCTERTNGHHRTVSIDTGSSCCRDGSSSKASPNYVTGNALLNFWSSVLKASLIFRVGGPSLNGLKRWKDGECDAIDPCKILDSDIEQGCSIFTCQDGSWSEMQTSQGFQKGVYLRRLVRTTSALLAIIGLVGLYLH